MIWILTAHSETFVTTPFRILSSLPAPMTLPQHQTPIHSSTSSFLHFFESIVVMFAAWVAFQLRFSWNATESYDPIGYLVITAIVSVLAALLLPKPKRHPGSYLRFFSRDTYKLVRTWVVILLVVLVGLFITKTATTYSRLWFLYWGILGVFFLLAFRAIAIFVHHKLIHHSYGKQRAIIIGTGQSATHIHDHLLRMSNKLIVVSAFSSTNANSDGPDTLNGLPVLNDLERLNDYCQENTITSVWITTTLPSLHNVEDILQALRHSTADIYFVPDSFSLRLINHSITDFAGLPVISLYATPMVGTNRLIKEVEDKLLASFFLLIASPVMLLIILGIKLTSPGPVFYRQERVGWNEQLFTMIKFRTMPCTAEDISGPRWATPGDDRATWLGKFLRKSSLDELPQFINVLRGEMSVVGPRPERPMFVEQFKKKIPDYTKKHMVKAGMTGWAQINGWRGDTDLNSRIDYDLFYIENWSLGMDLKIIALTFLRGFFSKNAY